MSESRETITYQGRTYQVGGGYHVPCPLPEWLPTVLPAAWLESREQWGPSRAYGRVYRKPGEGLLVLLSCAEQDDRKRWLHLSVSRQDHKIPTWEQMSQIKRLFIGDERTALQVMPPKAKHVSIHPGVLHLWCCLDGEVVPDFTAGGETI
jgi:hypothetical protein